MEDDLDSMLIIEKNGINHVCIAEIGLKKEEASEMLASSKKYSINPRSIGPVMIDGISYWGAPIQNYSK